MKRAVACLPAGVKDGAPVVATLELAHDARHLRRKRLELPNGDAVLVDLPETVALADGSVLVCEDGARILIRAAPEPLFAIAARDGLHLVELAWHLGNRHLAAQIETGRILILRDHVIKAMVEGLGGSVTAVVEPFTPVRGAYHHGQAHDAPERHRHDDDGHGHAHDTGHAHGHG